MRDDILITSISAEVHPEIQRRIQRLEEHSHKPQPIPTRDDMRAMVRLELGEMVVNRDYAVKVTRSVGVVFGLAGLIVGAILL